MNNHWRFSNLFCIFPSPDKRPSGYFPAEAQHGRAKARPHALEGSRQIADFVARAYTVSTDRRVEIAHGNLVGDFPQADDRTNDPVSQQEREKCAGDGNDTSRSAFTGTDHPPSTGPAMRGSPARPSGQRRARLALALLLMLAAPAAQAGASAELRAQGWRELANPHKAENAYRLGSDGAIEVVSQASVSTLYRPVATHLRDRPVLTWRWRVDQFPTDADLKKRSGDDTALKVCVFFDLALDQVPADQRRALEFVRKRKPEAPAATICYVWDERLAADSVLPNAFTTRMRYIVLEGGTTPLRQWRSVRRDIAADFQRLYGDETKVVPPVLGVGIGGDSDNTKSRSTAYIADLSLVR